MIHNGGRILALPDSPRNLVGTIIICVTVRHTDTAEHALAVLAFCDTVSDDHASKNVLTVFAVAEIQCHFIVLL